jgi:hypothetical protein
MKLTRMRVPARESRLTVQRVEETRRRLARPENGKIEGSAEALRVQKRPPPAVFPSKVKFHPEHARATARIKGWEVASSRNQVIR